MARRAKPTPTDPPKRGRPRKLVGDAPPGQPGVYVPLDEASGLGLMTYSSIFSAAGRPRVTLQDAVRDLAAAYYSDHDVQRAVHAWRARRG